MKHFLRPQVLAALLLGAAYPMASQVTKAGPAPSDRRAESTQTFDQRESFERKSRVFPLRAIPRGARRRALQQIHQAEAAQAAVGGFVWSNIGPAPIADSTGPNAVGRVAAIAIDPSTPAHWLLGAAQGGIWQSANSGNDWSPQSDDSDSLAIGDIAFAPSNASIVYAGTGEGNFSTDSYAGMGMLKSTDGGTTWNLLAGSWSSISGTPLTGVPFEETAFSRIQVSPANANSLVVATVRGILGRVQMGTDIPPDAPARGVFVSSDGGNSWKQTLAGEATDIAVSPANTKNQYAALGEIFGAAVNGVYRTTNGGTSWQKIDGPWVGDAPAGSGRIRLVGAPSDANRLYVSVASTRDSDTGLTNLIGIWMTKDAWDAAPKWTEISNPGAPDPGGFPWYSQNLIVSASNPKVLYYAGIEMWRFDGTNWEELPDQHSDQHGLAWVAGSNTVIATHDGGVSSLVDGSSTWNSLINDLAITQFYKGSVESLTSAVVMGGSQDNGTAESNGTEPWTAVFGGDGNSNAIASVVPIQWAVSTQAEGGTSIFRTTDGINFSSVSSGIDYNTVDFFITFIMHPANHNLFIAGSTNLWRCDNFFSATTPQWSSNSPTLQTGANKNAQITAMAFAPSDSAGNTYAYGTEDGQLRLTTNAGATWMNINASGDVPGRYVSGLAFSPQDANQLWVALSGFDEGTPGHAGHTFKTANALSGTSAVWSNVSPPADLPADAIAVSPLDDQNIFVGSDIGVWETSNGGTSWIHFGPTSGLPNVAVFDLQFDAAGHITAFTHGRGAFRLGISPLIIPPLCTIQCLFPWLDPGSLVENPGDPIDFNLPLINVSGVAGGNITATLVPSALVVPAGGSQVQSYGELSARAGIVSRSFNFTLLQASGAGTEAARVAESRGFCVAPTANPPQVNVTFALTNNGTSLGNITLPFTLGTLVTPLTQNFERAPVPQLPEGWLSVPARGWVTSSRPPPNVLTSREREVEMDALPPTTGPVSIAAFAAGLGPDRSAYLNSPAFRVRTEHATLQFRHSFEFDPSFAGATLQIAIGRGPFRDILQSGGSFSQNGYNTQLPSRRSSSDDARRPSQAMWSGSSGGYLISKVNLPARAGGHLVRLRWRVFGQDTAKDLGWYVDDVSVKEYPLAGSANANGCSPVGTGR